MARPPSTAGRIPAASAALFAVLAVGAAGAAQRAAFNVERKRPVVPASAFKIIGTKLRPLRPGTSQALNLWLGNPHRYTLAVMRLTVGIVVDRPHARAGCDRRRDFRSIRMPRSAYPIRLPPRRTVSLRRLGVRVLPRVAMVARPRNQDACKGARLTLTFGGRARPRGAGRPR
jgi:hypothetical protein